MKKSIFTLLIVSVFVANVQVSAQKSTTTADRLVMTTPSKVIMNSPKSRTNNATLAVEVNETVALTTNKQEVYTPMNGCSAGESYLPNYSIGIDANFNNSTTNEQKKSEHDGSSLDEAVNLINAIKELKKENETLKKANEIANIALKKQNEELKLLVKKVSAIEDLLDFAQK